MTMPPPQEPRPPHHDRLPRTALADIALLFLKLGATAFGGPAAHIAMMEDEVVGRRAWMTRAEFLDFLGATNLIPGPNSTEMAIHIGRLRRGWPGLLVAGCSFILPSTLFVLLLAWAYVRLGSLPQIAGLLYGVKPVVIALIVHAVLRLGRSAVKSPLLAVVGLLAVAGAARGFNQFALLAAGGVLTGLLYRLRFGRPHHPQATALMLLGSPSLSGLAVASPFALGPLFLVFLKIGAVLFGGGYVLVALLRANLVAHLGWITEKQLLDAVAIGQVTPGPISTSATFLGYLLAGVPGGAVATLGIFLPAFVFVAITGPYVRQLRRSALAAAVLDGVNVAAVALIAVVCWQLFRSAVVDWTTLTLAAASFLLLASTRINSTWLIMAGALAGVVKAVLGR